MGAPNWAEIITALATAATVGLLLWDRLWRRVPDLIVTFRPGLSANNPSLYYVLIQPIEWGSVLVERIQCRGVEVAKPIRTRDLNGDDVVTGYEAWTSDVRFSNLEVTTGGQRPTSILLSVRPTSLRWPWQKTRTMTVTSFVTSPVRRRIRNKMAISIAN